MSWAQKLFQVPRLRDMLRMLMLNREGLGRRTISGMMRLTLLLI